MAASNDGEDEKVLGEGAPRESPGVTQRYTSNEGDADGDAHDETPLQLNPEVLTGINPLPGLEDIEVILIQPADVSARWTEGLMIHVVGSGIVAVLAFVAGLMFAGASNQAEGRVEPPVSRVLTPVPAPVDKAE
jgi:hypothetical protein